MKRAWWNLIGLFVLAVLLGPVVIEQFSADEHRPLSGVSLDDLDYTEVTFKNEDQDLQLAGMLFRPDGPGPYPTVVVIHGSGTSSRDNPWYLTLTDHLRRNGIAVLLPDKRGSVQSEGDWRTSSFEDLATDTLAAIDFIQAQDEVPVSYLGVIGLSQGGQITPIVAAQSDRVDFVINMVGSAVPLHQALIFEETHNLRQMGFLPGVSDAIARPSTLFLRLVSQSEFWQAVGNFDPLPYWQETEAPALVLYGEDDTNSPSQQSRARLESLGREDLEIITFAGSGHALEDPIGQGNRFIREEALEAIVSFINSIEPPPLEFAKPAFQFLASSGEQPIVSNTPTAAIDNQYINPGAVTYHDGQFHMFFNSFTSWPGTIEVGYLTSPDGISWQVEQDEPVFSTDQIPYGQGEADVSSILVTDEGQWLLFFHTIRDGQIGLARADQPTGPFTADPEPILTPGPDGAWDSDGLAWPSLISTEDELRLYYSGRTIGGAAIGYASSTDGVTWTKYNDPNTGEAPYTESDPVLQPTESWESIQVDRPRVVRTDRGWVMIYQGGSQVSNRGLAASRDGINWIKYSENPFLGAEDFPIDGARTWDTALMHYQDNFLYLMEIGTLSGTDLFLANHQGELLH